MAINYEIKSQLAKLLATEDLVVENKPVATAQFNVETRVLTLPMWKRASNSVYDMLVGHEVGHALFTPNDWSFEGTVPQQFVNVTEDARIEKLMKRKYPGLHKSFNAGYKELAEEDFFCLDGEDIDNMNLADKANLYFKIGKHLDITFTDEEKVIIEQIGDAETFDEAVEAAKVMYAYCKKPQKESQPVVIPPSPNGQSGGQSVQQESQNIEGSGDTDDVMTHEEMLEEAANRESADEPEENLPEPEVTTDSTFEDRKEEFNGDLDIDSQFETGYHELPEFNVDDLIVSFSEIRNKFDWTEDLFMKEDSKSYAYVDAEYSKFKKSAQKEVNFLVKEFECKKAADSYSRSATSRTGVLDCTKLHTYKYNEDLFKKVTILPDGKNHGLIFILDWSGSMGNCILDTVKQLYNLIWFCNKCNIPFDVYAFTNSYVRNDEEVERKNIWEDDKLFINGDFRLMNFFSSREKKKDIEKQMQSLYRLVWSMKMYCCYSYPPEFSLSGTPLNETLIALSQILPAFKKMHGLQKTHCFILTDGEANPLMVSKRNSYGGQGTRHLYPGKDFIRNRKTGHTYQVKRAYHSFTKILLQNLMEENKDCNFVGIRLCAPREMNSFIRSYQHVTDDALKKIKKQKYYEIKNTGYTSYFAMQSNALNQEADFDVEEGASKAKIKSAFVKNLKTKALNKKVLSKFMELVA
tara:strand:+ start:3730 stop:5805 length:2076 start_codon:yes stop_codon:yes gene_type:complete